MNTHLRYRARFGLRAHNPGRESTGLRRRRPALECLEARSLLSSIVDYPVPSPGALPSAITLGPDGNLWFTESLGNEIGMINPTTHVVTQFTLPGNYMDASTITTGPDGNLWFTNMTISGNVTSGAIGMINPTTHAISEFPDGLSGTVPEGITAGPDGNLWFASLWTNDIGIINPTTDAITLLPVPGPYNGASGITTGPDGNIWVSLIFDNSIAMINPTTHAITEFAVPTPGVGPDQIVAGPDGNLWFTESYDAQIGMINPTTHAITEIPLASAVGGITTGPGGNLWFTMGNNIAMMNPATFAVTTFPDTDPGLGGADPQGITLGPDGNLWFAETSSYAIGVLDPTGSGIEPVMPSMAPGIPFGFTLTVYNKPAIGDATSGDTVTLALADGAGGDTLTVSTRAGVSTYSGLTIKKHGGSYDLLTNAVSPVRASVRSASLAKARPLLVEKELTAGTGKRKHVIGVEVVFNKSLDPSLAEDIAKRFAQSAGHQVGVQLVSSSTGSSAGLKFAGHAGFAPGGQIVVVAKS